MSLLGCVCAKTRPLAGTTPARTDDVPCRCAARAPLSERLAPSSALNCLLAKGRHHLTLVANAAPFSWKELDSPEYARFIANLRSVGCPRETLVDIVVSEVNRLYVARAKDAMKDHPEDFQFIYWRVESAQLRARTAAEKFKETLAQLDSERRRLLKQLLGDDIRREEMLNPFGGLILPDYDQRMSFLSYEKRKALEQIEKDSRARFDERIKPGAVSREGLKFMDELHADEEAKRAAILTPEELLQYNLRFGKTATVSQ